MISDEELLLYVKEKRLNEGGIPSKEGKRFNLFVDQGLISGSKVIITKSGAPFIDPDSYPVLSDKGNRFLVRLTGIRLMHEIDDGEVTRSLTKDEVHALRFMQASGLVSNGSLETDYNLDVTFEEPAKVTVTNKGYIWEATGEVEEPKLAKQTTVNITNNSGAPVNTLGDYATININDPSQEIIALISKIESIEVQKSDQTTKSSLVDDTRSGRIKETFTKYTAFLLKYQPLMSLALEGLNLWQATH